jgi:threonine dehydratase
MVVELANWRQITTARLHECRRPCRLRPCGRRQAWQSYSMQFSSEELAWATDIVGRWVPPTPQYVWPLLADHVDGEVWVKHENHTPTGAFKVRGGLVYAERLRIERPEVKGIVSATRGNHGQSLAFAGRAAGIGVTIVVPTGNSPDKNAAMRGFGADLIVHGHDFQSAREHASAIGAQRGLEIVPSYHPDLVLGVATYARELFDAAGELDTVYVPVGMGSGISAIIGVRDLLGLRTEVVGVVAEEAPATARSMMAGRVITTETANTFVDGVACRVPDEDAIAVICSGASRVLVVSEDDAAEAMRVLFATTHNVAEPAGALALAGLLAERSSAAGKRVALIQTGGNADAGLLLQVLAGQTPTV